MNVSLGHEKTAATPSGAARAHLSDPCAEFQAWKEKYLGQGISEERRDEVEKFAASFEAILARAADAGAEDHPEEFLKSLSASEREVLQHLHGLARPINLDGLSTEGAVNLLRSPGSARDLDRDGFQTIGAAKTWTFPPPDAPAEVKEAWEETTRGLSELEVVSLQGSFLPISVPGYDSPSAYLGADADFSQLVRDAIAGAEFSRRFDEPWQTENRERQIALLKDLLSRLASGETAA